MDEYGVYLDIWLNGLKDEINFWNKFIKNEGGEFFFGFDKTVNPNRLFELENDIPSKFEGKIYSFVDVGAGPFSRCGRITNKVILKALSVDPLAYAYNMLKDKYSVDNGLKLVCGFVELLEYDFLPNTFDMVHMSNALDHSFSPIDGVYQLLNICKVGGKVILRHAENEAEREFYQGLHQWNLSLHNEENSFIIWRGNNRFDVCKMFGEYADIQLYPDVKEKNGNWVYNKVVMTKKCDIPLPKNQYYDVLLKHVYKYMLEGMAKDIFTEEKESVSPTDWKLNKIRDMFHNKCNLKMYINKNEIDNVIIYGMGAIGKNLAYLLQNVGVHLKVCIDKQGKECGFSNAVTLEECTYLEADVIIITTDKQVNEIKCALEKKSSSKIMHIDEFLINVNECTT